jgi:serine/threonine protein kinase/Flp pilus assembly protein TadD
MKSMMSCAGFVRYLRAQGNDELLDKMRAPFVTKVCDTCGATLDLEAPSGFCPACLLGTALEIDTTDPSEISAAGTRIEDYEIINEVARGGMGIVYRARQNHPNRVVALKMILPSHVGSHDAVARFRAEAEAAASLDHECILPIYAVGEKDGVPFYSMKFAEGGNLSARIKDFQHSPRKSAALIAALARAVEYAHVHGILHRDLKPGNVLFDAARKPFVSDFGLAKWLERETDLTQTLAILGTPFYMAPEQATGARTITAAADIYSLGAILFHLLTGRPPFRGGNPMEVLRHAAERPPPRPRALNRRIPSDLETICLKCLEKDPAVRYASAAALADDLDRFIVGRPIRARRAGPAKHFLRWIKRNPVMAGLATAFLCLIGLLVHLTNSRAPGVVAAQPGIAVLPFENLSDDKTNAYFASGIHDDLLVNLSKIADLKVISQASVLPYKDTPRDLPAIGRALAVNAVLEGSVRHTGSYARINVRLIDTKKGEQIWAESYDRELTDAFAIQSNLAFEIASALKAKLTPVETARLRRPPTQSGEAYLLYVQANDYAAGRDKLRPDLEKAEELYQRAVKLDPSFALAYGQLARLESVFYSYREQTPARRAKAQAAVDEALRLQPELPEAHLAQGDLYWRSAATSGDFDFANALREFEIARRGLPNDPDIFAAIGRIRRHQGKWSESIADLEKAAALDPNTPDRWHRIFYSYELTRNYPAASAALDRAIALSPNSWDFELHRAFLKFFWNGDLTGLEQLRAPTGMTPDDRKTEDRFAVKRLLRKFDEAESILRQDPRETLSWAGVRNVPKSFLFGEVYFQAGRKEQARTAYAAALPSVERSAQENPHEPSWSLLLAEIYAGVERPADAVRECKRATELMPESKSAWGGPEILESVAQTYAMLGDARDAVPILRHVLAVPSDMHRQRLRFDPVWDPVRGDPRFQQLLEQ